MTSHCLAQLAAGLNGLPAVNSLLQTAVAAAGVQLRSLHGQRFWCSSSEQQWGAAPHGARLFAAQAQLQHSEDEASFVETPLRSMGAPYDWRSAPGSTAGCYPTQLQTAALDIGHAQQAGNAEAGHTSIQTAADQPAAAYVELQAASPSSIADHDISAEGDVVYPEDAPLLRTIQRHWKKLQSCPSAADYSERVSFDEFGYR